jgi:hypothetical protein
MFLINNSFFVLTGVSAVTKKLFALFYLLSKQDGELCLLHAVHDSITDVYDLTNHKPGLFLFPHTCDHCVVNDFKLRYVLP